MAFRKIVLVNIKESDLDKKYWDRIDSLTRNKVFLPKDSPEIMKESKDTDCLLVGFAVPVTKEHIDAAPDLKYIGTLAIAYHKIDDAYARKKGRTRKSLSIECAVIFINQKRERRKRGRRKVML